MVKIKFSSKLDYQMFPFDDHRIYFILTNLFLDPDDAIYVVPSVDFIVSKDVSIPGWVLKGHEVVFGKTPLIEGATGLHESYPQVIFILELEKNSLGIIFTIIIPLLIMFFVSLVSILQASVIGNFSKKVFNWDNYSISIGNLAAVLAYRFVIQTVSPDVGYLTVCDYFYIFVLGSTVISLMIAIYCNICTKEADESYFVCLNKSPQSFTYFLNVLFIVCSCIKKDGNEDKCFYLSRELFVCCRDFW